MQPAARRERWSLELRSRRHLCPTRSVRMALTDLVRNFWGNLDSPRLSGTVKKVVGNAEITRVQPGSVVPGMAGSNCFDRYARVWAGRGISAMRAIGMRKKKLSRGRCTLVTKRRGFCRSFNRTVTVTAGFFV